MGLQNSTSGRASSGPRLNNWHAIELTNSGVPPKLPHVRHPASPAGPAHSSGVGRAPVALRAPLQLVERQRLVGVRRDRAAHRLGNSQLRLGACKEAGPIIIRSVEQSDARLHAIHAHAQQAVPTFCNTQPQPATPDHHTNPSAHLCHSAEQATGTPAPPTHPTRPGRCGGGTPRAQPSAASAPPWSTQSP